MHHLTLADAKTRLLIPALWTHFGFAGQPKASCRSPFRKDRRPSFSVSRDGLLWNDFATGESGDAVDFFQRASGLSCKETCRKFIQLAGGTCTPTPRAACPKSKPEARPKPSFPDFARGGITDFERLAKLRNLSREGLRLASERGLLWFATLKDCPAWIVTDAARVNAQARRMDGQPWEHIEAKAWTLPGSWASWPIGAQEEKPFPSVALVEGGPDLLAACHFIVCEDREMDCAPVAMLGASQRIHTQALSLFAGKRIRIFGHDDDDGQRAVGNWARQLQGAGAEVDAFDFNGLRKVEGSPVKDLNDLTSTCADDFETNRDLWSLLP